MKTPVQEFLEQIILKKVKGSVYLLLAITDTQINDLLEKEKQIVIDAYFADDMSGGKYKMTKQERAEQLVCESCKEKFIPIDKWNYHCQKCQPCKPLEAN